MPEVKSEQADARRSRQAVGAAGRDMLGKGQEEQEEYRQSGDLTQPHVHKGLVARSTKQPLPAELS